MESKSLRPSPENKEAETQKVLDYYFRPRLTHDLSKDLPENKEFDIKKYEETLKPYGVTLEEYRKIHEGGESSEEKFLGVEGANVGWKFHLNSSPEHIQTIFKYLTDNGYLFKYLSGGEPADGKVFTVYIGEYKLAKQLAEELSGALVDKLARPADHTEIEFAPGVVGRFVGPKSPPEKFRRFSDSPVDFHQYGTCGFSLSSHDMGQLLYQDEENIKEFIKNAEARAFLVLKDRYKEKFFED